MRTTIKSILRIVDNLWWRRGSCQAVWGRDKTMAHTVDPVYKESLLTMEF